MKRFKAAILLLSLAFLAGMISGCSSDGSSPDAGLDMAQDDGDAGVDGGDPVEDGGPDADGSADSDGSPVPLGIQAVLPSRGPVAGGTWANIVGGGCGSGVGESAFDVRDVTAVRFCDNSAIDIEVIRDDMISVRTPAGLPGACPVTVENPKGTVVLTEAFTYFETVAAFGTNPEDLSAEGGTSLEVTGTGFSEDSHLLVAGRPAAQLTVHDSTRLSALAPPGPAGPADVEVVNRNGRALIFRGVTYHAQPLIDSVDPMSGPTEGGQNVFASGTNFGPEDAWTLRAQPAEPASYLDDSSWTLTTPAAPEGSVDVEVSNPVLSHRLAGGYIYLPTTTGDPALSGCSPSSGPSSGGQSVILAGEGMDEVSSVSFGDQMASDLNPIDGRHLQLTAPAHPAGPVTVSMQTSGEPVDLDGGYRYFDSIAFESLTPQTGSSEGGTPFVLLGEGFHLGTRVSFCGILAEALQLISPTELRGQSPAGPAGVCALRLADYDQFLVIEDAFSYSSPLELYRVQPDSGAQAGGTYLTIYGSHFDTDMQVFFGDQPASLVQVFSPSVAAVRTPRGDPGEVDVRVVQGEAEAILPAGFAYFDPTNDRGGASGGNIQGSVNITVLDGGWATYGQPLPEATVIIAEPPISGLTDDRGQVTFSGPSLVRAVTITAGKEGFQAITVADLNAANLSVYLTPNEQEPPDITPGETKYSTLSGRVFGFKDIPGLPSGPDIRYEARVTSTSYSIYSVPPYAGVPSGWPIEEDGGRFDFTVRLGTYNLYALYGAFDLTTEQFTPALLGVRRNIVVASEDQVSDQDIILSTALDQAVEVRHQQAPTGFGDNAATYGAYVSLDLGRDGVIHLSQVSGPGTEAVLPRLPSATGEAFLFVGLASINGGYPLSYTFRRQEGDISQGVDLGPYLGFAQILTPAMGEELNDGHITWEIDGPQPALIQLVIQTPDLFPKTLWRLILPGDAREVSLPEELLSLLPQGEALALFIYTADSPRFEFDRFNNSQLSTSRWTGYSVNYTGFTMP